jgi:hypothetical protein
MAGLVLTCLYAALPATAVEPDDDRPFPDGVPAGRSLTIAEYFVDADPGEGKGIDVDSEDLAYDEATESLKALSLDAANLADDAHRVGLRFRDDLGRWSPATYLEFHVVDLSLVEAEPEAEPQVDHLSLYQVPDAGTILKVTLEDNDYTHEVQQGDDLEDVRAGLAAALASNPTADAELLADGRIRLTGKQPGDAYDLSLDAQGLTTQRTQQAEPDFPEGVPVGRSLTLAEYFIDADPGEGEGIAVDPEDLAYDEATESLKALSLGASNLADGAHRIGIRFQDDLGRWSPATYLEFHVVDLSLVEAEPEAEPQVDHLSLHWLPTAGTVLKVTLGGNDYTHEVKQGDDLEDVRAGLAAALASNPTADAELLADGRIRLTTQRTQQAEPDFPEGVPAGRSLTLAEYFIDADPGEGEGIDVDPEDFAYDEATEGIIPLSVSIHDVPAGSHRLGIRFRDDPGNWGSIRFIDFVSEHPGSYAPRAAKVTPETITENLAPGTWSGTLSALSWGDPSGTQVYQYSLPEDNASDNQYFQIQGNATLVATQSFDFEVKPSLTLRIRIQNESNATMDKKLKIPITDDKSEDNDGDGLSQQGEEAAGTSDFLEDTDGDGFSDPDEIAANTNPTSRHSNPNRAPTGLLLSANLIPENQPAGTTVGSFSTIDPDDPLSREVYSYALVNGNHSAGNNLFVIDENGSLRTVQPLDYETATKHPIRVRATDASNASLVEIFEVRVKNVFAPIVRTRSVTVNRNGRLNFSGKILADKYSRATAAGLLVSDNLQFSNAVQLAATNLRLSSFSVQLSGSSLQPSKKYYYRTYATNEEGTSNGTKKRFTTPEKKSESASWRADAEEKGAGWRESTWFGIFRPFNNGWLYHGEIGWLYAIPDDDRGGVWLWKKGRGWLWTAKGVYPHFYRNEIHGWLYFLKAKGDKAYFYRHTDGVRISVPR